jgi:hypothetical protein
MKLTKRQLKRIIREEKRNILESKMGEVWYECMDALFNMALDNGYVCCLCASKAIAQWGEEATMNDCCQLISDCCEDGMLTPMAHPQMPQITVYAAID